jgi:hypothetical protein
LDSIVILGSIVVLNPIGVSSGTGITSRRTGCTARFDYWVTRCRHGGARRVAIGKHFVSATARQCVPDEDKRCSNNIENTSPDQKCSITEVGKGILDVRTSWDTILGSTKLRFAGIPTIFDDTATGINGVARGTPAIIDGITGNVTVMVYAGMVTCGRTNATD